ncbi:MAG: transposase [Deltaproteobacteria bacterium]|nr:transposase [Deltaproteobacteria bacterium]
MTDDGRVRLTLRRPAKNGQGAIVLSPVQFLRRLAWLVPPPAQHQVRYAGVLASASKVRRAIVPRPAPVLQLAFPIENMRPRVQKHRMSWAKLLARVYSIDGERCLSCGGPLRPIGAVTESSHVAQTLGRMRRQRCARDPPQLALDLDRLYKPTQGPTLRASALLVRAVALLVRWGRGTSERCAQATELNGSPVLWRSKPARLRATCDSSHTCVGSPTAPGMVSTTHSESKPIDCPIGQPDWRCEPALWGL